MFMNTIYVQVVKNTPVDPLLRVGRRVLYRLMMRGANVMNTFDRAFEIFMEKHIDESGALRKERLLNGLGFGKTLLLKVEGTPS